VLTRFSNVVTAAILLLLAGYIFLNETTARREAQFRMDRHARVISASLSRFDPKDAADYLSEAVQNDAYERLDVTTSDGAVFFSGQGNPLDTGTDLFFDRLHLIPRLSLQTDVPYARRVVGQIQATARIKTVYADLYAVVVAILLVLITQRGIAASIAERKKAEEQRLKAFVSATFEGIIESESGRIITCNEQFARLLGSTVQELEGQCIADLVAPGDRERVSTNLATGEGALLEHAMLRRDGTSVMVESHGRPAGLGGRRFTAMRDITDQKNAEESLRRSNRELRAITECNEILVRAEDETNLLRDLCHIIHEKAGYIMVWVGYAEKDEGKTVRPVAWAGAEGLDMRSGNVTWADTERGRGPAGAAIRTGKTTYVQDITTDPRVAPWSDVSRRRGFRSVIGLPLQNETGETFGALTIFSDVPNAFTPDEIRLLEELTSGLAYGITTLRTRAARKQAEAANLRLAAIVESSEDAIISQDLNGTIQSWNHGAEKLFGYPAHEALEQPTRIIVPADRVSEDNDILTRIARGESVHQLETVRRRKNAELIEVSVTISPIRNTDGKITGASRILRDITERRRAEAVLNESKQRLRLFVEHSPAAIAMFDREMRYLVTSRRWLADYRLGDADIAGRSHYEVFPEISEAWKEIHRRCLAGAVEKCAAEAFPRTDGTMDWVRWEVHPWRTGEGTVGGIIIFTEVITELKRAEMARQESETRILALGDNLSKGMIYQLDMGTDGRERHFTYVSAGVEKLHEVTAKAVLKDAQMLYRQFVDEDLSMVAALESEAVATMKPFIAEVRSRQPSGAVRWSLLASAPRRASDGRILLDGIELDITERHQAEQQERLAHGRVRALVSRLQTLREEERTRIAREIHDHLGQLLTALKLDLRGIERKVSSLDSQELHVALAEKLESARTLTDEVIASVQKIASDLRPGLLDRLGLSAAIEAETQTFQNRTGIRCSGSFLSEPLPLSPEKASSVFRIFQEILTNIARHAHASKVGVRLARQAGTLLLQVEDNGVGIRPADLEHPKSLGLLGMNERATILGGAITFAPAGERGTCVTLQIPLH
jgi:PAS domain S-box-containing protein